MKITRQHYFALGTSLLLIVILLIFFRNTRFIYFLIGLAFVIGALPFFITFLSELGREREKEEQFLEFSRDLAESVAVGIPISRAILKMAERDYGSLSPYVKKLANQIALGIPFKKALKTFAKDVKNKVVSRSVNIIIQAEESGGKIGSILGEVVKSIREIEDIKKERRTLMYSQIMQGYIIFTVFLVIILVLQFWLLPQMKGITDLSGDSTITFEDTQFFNKILLALLFIQSIFMGLVIGQLSEGSIKAGIKHSALLILMAYLIVSIAHALIV